MAANYGWALSFLKSDKELWKLFNKAVDKSYSVNRFVAALRNTNWFKKHSDTWRQAAVLQKTDPKTFQQRWRAKEAELHDIATQLGADLPAGMLNKITTNVIWMGMNDAQVRNVMANYIDQFGSTGHYGGEAGKAEDELRNYADDMGVTLSDTSLKGWLKDVVSLKQTTEDYKGYIQKQAESTYSVWADRIKSGQTLRQIAEPYMQQMGQILELNPAQITLQNNSIKQALQYKDKDGKAASKTLWQFAEDLRKDPRWLKTNNARDSMMTAGQQILKDFGFHY